jgi:hypothetical protein
LGLNLAELCALAVDFDLQVFLANEGYITVGFVADKITCFENSGVRIPLDRP